MGTFLKDLKVRTQSGFTLVELMVVVAIIGILSAVAIPNFKTYQAKSKTSEAKLQLASLYSAEVSWLADYDTYATCLANMGYNPANEVANRYYAVGFSAGFAGTPVGPGCTAAGFVFPAGKFSGTNAGNCGGGLCTTVTAAASGGATPVAAKNTFQARARGNITTDSAIAIADEWRIDENKLLAPVSRGY